ncbi:MAG: tyrosine-type recombinase/integrase [Hyphomicrobium sp.]
MPKSTDLALQRISTISVGTRARSDAELIASWLASLTSAHTRRNFELTASRFREALTADLRTATVEDVREAVANITAGLSNATARQYLLRVKSLLSYAHNLGYSPFNAGVTIKVRPDQSGAGLAKRIISEVEVGLLIREANSTRDEVLLKTLYAGGLRVSELVALSWADVIERDTRIQLSVTGKGGRIRQVLLPETVATAILALRSDAGANDPVFASRKGGRLSERAVNYMLKRAAERAGITGAISPHWLRHAHGSHALDRGATLAEVQTTLGHANVATTSGYLHARPDTSSGLRLDPGIFR